MKPRKILNKLRVYPDEFYLGEQEKSYTTQYVETPIGGEVLVPERLANAQKAWKANKFSHNKKKKTLVLADWTLSSLQNDDQEIEKIKQRIGDLLDDGFTVYMWRDNKTIRITRKLLNELKSSIGRIFPADNNHIIEKITSEHELSRDSIHVLDDYWFKTLTDPSVKLNDREFDIKYLMNQDEEYRRKMYEILKKARPPVKKIINTKWSSEIEALETEINDVFSHLSDPDLPIPVDGSSISIIENTYKELQLTSTEEANNLLTNSTKIKLSENEIDKVESAHFIELNTGHLNQLFLRFKKFNILTKLHLNSEGVTLPLNFEVFQNAPITLTSLKIEDYQLTLRKELVLSALQNLILNRVEVNEETLLRLFLSTINLKFLDLSNVTLTPSSTNLPWNDFLPELEELKLDLEGVNEKLAGNLLSNKPHLKSLTLSSNSSNLTLENMSPFPALEYLHLISCKIGEKGFTNLFSQSPNLKAFHVESDDLTNLVGNFMLPSLTEVDIKECKLAERNLASLLNQAGNLKTVTLTRCKISSENESQIEFMCNPSAVKKLHLIESDDWMATLLLFGRPQIKVKSLHLEKCKALNLESLFTTDLSNLTELVIEDCEMTDADLLFLLNSAPNLKTFIIRNLKLTVKLDAPKLPTFSVLNKLEIGIIKKNQPNEDIKTQRFFTKMFTFLNTDNHVNELNIYKSHFRESFSERLHLSTLNKLTFSSTSQKELEKTLSCAVNLVSLNLASIEMLQVPKRLHLTHLNHLTLNHCKLSAENFINLTSSSPLLTLNINFGNISGELLDTLTFPSLLALNLTATDISKENFVKLIKKAPKLQSIYLDSVQDYLKDDSELEKLLKERKIQVNVASTVEINWKDITREGVPIIDSEHDPREMLHASLPPDPKSFKFKYLGENKTKNQGMIIEKVSQYLTLTNSQYCEYIPAMHNGICDALAALFDEKLDEKPIAWWKDLFNTLLTWNGKEPLNKNLDSYCSTIINKYIDKYVKPLPKRSVLLGENLSTWTKDNYKTLIKKGSFTLYNPWHAISFRYENKKWFMYDPNFVDGYKEIDINKIQEEVKKRLGNLILVDKKVYEKEKKIIFPEPKISNPNAFIRDGGLLALIAMHDQELMTLGKLVPSPAQLSEEDISQGLLIRDVRGRPAWTKGLLSNNPSIRNYTNNLINSFASLNKNYAEIIAKSIRHITDPKEHSLYLDLLCLPLPAYSSDKGKEPDIAPKNPVNEIPAKDADIFPPKPSDLKDESTRIRENIRHAIHVETQKTRYEKQFETWENQPAQSYSSPLKYYQHLINGEKNKRLIKLSSSSDIEKLGIELQKLCDHIYTDATQQKLYHPTYYIHSPDDLVCSASYIEKEIEERDGKKIIKGHIEPGPGGPLDKFLKEHDDVKPILIVNYDNFGADDLVRLNSLLDKHPTADGTPLPKEAIVIGLINPNKPGSYKGADFYSRFGKEGVETCPLSFSSISPVPLRNKSAQKKVFSINFFHAGDWKERLFGRWKMQDNNLIFQEGILQKALDSGRPINIKNGPWNDPDFNSFWNRARELGYIEWEGKRFNIPNKAFYQENIYNWKKLTRAGITVDGYLDARAKVLNPTTFGRFFNNHICNNKTKKLTMLPGFIEEHQGQELSVNVTRQLTDDEWAMLLAECKKHNVKLHCHCAPSVTLPKELPQPKEFLSVQVGSLDEVIECNDIDVAVAYLNVNQNWQVIDISECDSTDLLTKLDGQFNEKDLTFSFTESTRALLQALQKDQNVILKGKFSPELADALAPLLLERQADKGKGKIVLISDDAAHFNYFPVTPILKDKVNEQKQAILKIDGIEVQPKWLKDYSLSQLRAKIAYAKALNIPLDSKDNDPWKGLKGLSGGIKLTPVDQLDITRSEKIAEEFIWKRQKGVDSLLLESPYVFLTGLTGVGKSTFVEKHLATKNDVLYLGEKHIKKWAGYVLAKKSEDKIKENIIEFKLDATGLNYRVIDLNDVVQNGTILWKDLPKDFPSNDDEILDNKDKWLPTILSATAERGFTPKADGRKILFVDEANITQRQWSEFEGLFNNPPTILIDGILYPLTDQHKVIFAGNPLNYGGERMMAPLFDQHGGAFVFEPMPIEFIYEKILKPVFEKTPLDNEKIVFDISKEILKLYEFLCNCSQSEVLISPRELQMIALLVVAHAINSKVMLSPDEIMDVTKHYIFQVAKNLVPPMNIQAFNDKFKPIRNQFKKPIVLKHGKDDAEKYLVTESREPVYQYLTDLIALREYRRHPNTSLNEAQLYGGLGGLIIEGEPATGKSELVFATLTSCGYKKGKLAKKKKHAGTDVEATEVKAEITIEQPTSSDKVFYYLPISMQLDQKIEYLKKAFDEGAIVVIDEINSAPMMERLLNELLMGKCDGKRPTHPGFMIIGTQNPVTMGGRYQPSAALKRRQTTDNLPLYSDDELISILELKGLEGEVVKPIVQTYQKKLAHAKQFHLDPEPTLRVLEEVTRGEVPAKRDIEPEKIAQEELVLEKVTEAKVPDLEPRSEAPVNDSKIEKKSFEENPLVVPSPIDPIKKDIKTEFNSLLDSDYDVKLPPGISGMTEPNQSTFWSTNTFKKPSKLTSNDRLFKVVKTPTDEILAKIKEIVDLSEWYNQTPLSWRKPTGIRQIITLIENNKKNNAELIISEIINICKNRIENKSLTRTQLTNDFYLIFANLMRDQKTNTITIDRNDIINKLNNFTNQLKEYDKTFRSKL